MSHHPRSRRGFSLVEAVMSMLVVSLMVGAAMSVSASAVKARAADADRATALALADALIDEVRSKAYREPGAVEVLGLDAGETHDDRTTCDDVDDYANLTEDPVVDEHGEKILGLRHWSRRVTVRWVALADPGIASGTATGLKRIEVEVLHQGRVLATRTTLRSAAE